MRLSNAELLSLLKRALEGSGWKAGRYEEPANAIWWLQRHGIPWLDNLPETWSRIANAPQSTPELRRNHASESIIDAGRSSLLHCGPNSIDLAFANACVEPLSSVQTRNCYDRMLILPGLALLAKRGACAMARWRSNKALHVATISAGQPYPEYIEYQRTGKSHPDHQSLMLICSRDAAGVNHHRRNLSNNRQESSILQRLEPDYFRKNAERSGALGIDVSRAAVNLMNKAGEQVFVAATEQSRKGAG